MNNEDFIPNRTRIELSFEKPYLWNYESNLTSLEDVDQIDTTAIEFKHSTNYAGSIFRGWFVPPATTRYRFYQSCDNYCSLWLSTQANDKTVATNIISEHSTNNRRYYDQYDGQMSNWTSLTAGENYYIEGLTYNEEGGDSFSVAVEIEQTEMVGHHHSLKEI